MTGGNQLKLSAVVSGTPLGEAIVEAHRDGVVVAGTSAGASIQSSHMVAFGGPGATPKQRMTQVAAGLGLLESAGDRPALRPAQPLRPAADDRQPVAAAARDRRRRGHRGRRDRRGRPAAAAGHRPRRRSRSSTPPGWSPTPTRRKRSSPLLASGVVLHVLPGGARLRPHRAAPWSPQQPAVDPEDAAELAEAQRDMRQAGPRHRGRRHLARHAAPAPGPQPHPARARDPPQSRTRQDGAAR